MALAQVQDLYAVPQNNGLAFDAARGRLYVADNVRQVLLALDLADGSELRSFPLALCPITLAISPNNGRLYVGEVHTNEAGYVTESPGKVAEIDMTEFRLLREVDYPYSPRGLLATDSGVLAITSPSLVNMEPQLRLWNINTGQSGTARSCTTYSVALDPAQNSLFGYGINNRFAPLVRVYFDSSTLNFTVLRATTDTGLVSAPVPSPDGQLLIAQGAAYQGSTNAAQDMKGLRTFDIGPGGNADAAFEPPNGDTFVLASGSGAFFFRRDTLEQFRHIDIGLTLRVAYAGDFVYAVVLTPTNDVRMLRFPNPAIGISTNQAPMPQFTWSPAAPSTRQEVLLDASSSTDDQTTGQLLYRWDFDNDGKFDTGYSTNAVAGYKFRTAGQHVVMLEVRDNFAATRQLQHAVAVTLESDPGEPAGTNVAWELPFPAWSVAFDPIRPLLYATDRLGKRLVVMNLTNGLLEHQWKFDVAPTAVAVRPDGSRLYVAQTDTDVWAVDPHGGGWVAELNPETRAMTHEFHVGMNTFAMLATDHGFLITHGEAEPERELHVYRTDTGELTGKRPCQPAHLALHPSQALVYAAGLQDSPPSLQRFTLDAATGGLSSPRFSSVYNGARIYPLPDGTNLVTGAGGLLNTNMVLTKDLGFGPNVAVTRIPERGLLAMFSKGTVRYFFEDRQEELVTQPALSDLAWATKVADRLCEVGVDATHTYLRWRMIPAVSTNENLPPVVTLHSPTNNQVIQLGQRIEIRATAGDLDGAVLGGIGLYTNGNLLFELPVGQQVLDWIPPHYGTIDIAAVAKDNLGVTNAGMARLIVNSPPSISLLNPTLAGPLYSPASFTLQAETSDPDGEVVRVDFYYGNQVYPRRSLGSAITRPFQINVTNLVGIGGALFAVARDNHGGITETSVNLNKRLFGLEGDDFYRPLVFPEGGPFVRTSNVDATRQFQEQVLYNLSTSNSLWWIWTAPSNCVVVLSTAGSSFDTCLGVCTGTNFDRLVVLEENDNDPVFPPWSRVKFIATNSVSYRFIVGGLPKDESGEVLLNMQLFPVPQIREGVPPLNDSWTNAFVLEGTNLTVTASNIGATNDVRDPASTIFPARKTVWWTWTPPGDGRVEISTAGSDFDTVLAVQLGASLPWNQVASGDDTPSTRQSRVSCDVLRGSTYYIVVGGFAGDSGTIQLKLDLLPPVPRPAIPVNDNFSNASVLAGDVFLARGYNDGATSEPGEPAHVGMAAKRSVWWKWRAADNTEVFLSLRCRSHVNFAMELATYLAVYTTADDSSLQSLATGKPQAVGSSGGYISITRFQAQAGRTYYIVADNKAGTGGDLELVLNGRLNPDFMALKPLGHAPNGQPRLWLRTSRPRGVELQNSPDLQYWVSVGTNTISNELELTVPWKQDGSTSQFYRLLGRD
jgi:DNA-binding beta-propeller fold protein YncE